LSKNDVIQLFEELERVTHLEYHTAIYQHPKLLCLLEKSEVSPIKVENHHKIRFKTQEEWTDFISFVSPYLTEAIDKLLSKVIRKSKFKDLDDIQPFFKLLTKHDKFYAFRKLNNFCETLSDRLEHLAYSHTTFPEIEVQYLRHPAFYSIVNELSDTFPNMPNSVAHAVINFTVNCERKVGRKKVLVEISDEAQRLQCDAHMKSLIVNNRDAFYQSREQVLGYNPNGVWRGLVAVVIILIMVFRVGSRCDSGPDYSPDFRNQTILEQYYNPTITKEPIEFYSSYFAPFHTKVVRSIEKNTYIDNHTIPQSEPCIISPFKKEIDSTGRSYTISNVTPSDMLVVISDGPSLRSHYIRSTDSTEIHITDSSQVFFYSGKDWNESRSIRHLFFSPRSGNPCIITFNGYFPTHSQEDEQFTSKLFTLTIEETEDFVIQHQEDGYELYQGDHLVNYSF